MIRINLLPQAKKAARAPAAAAAPGSEQAWAVVYLVAMVLFSVGLAGIYVLYQGELEEQRTQNNNLDAQIQRLRERSAQLEETRAKLQASLELETLVAELDQIRQGPTRVLMELSKILSAGGGPTIDPQRLEELRRENPLAGYNRSWDPRRLWLTEFREENRDCRMTGQGKTNEDVAEFLRRLALSEVFETVTLTKTEATEDNASGLSFIGFELTCRVRY
jgi:type IV pilus assembly protein PilN